MTTLRDLFLEQLADVYESERRIALALPQMIKVASHEGLRQFLRFYLYECDGHSAQVERIFALLGKEARRGRGTGIEGLLDEGDFLVFIVNKEGSPAIDAAIIAAVQKLIHYEIATYGCLRDWAKLLGRLDVATQLQGILDEKRACDVRLAILAQAGNLEALRGGKQLPPNPSPLSARATVTVARRETRTRDLNATAHV